MAAAIPETHLDLFKKPAFAHLTTRRRAVE